ncbi:MAG: transporter substrate-binding domain-containing protein [Hyphomicrobium sp.]|nr:transporter substrate-binding domain-containing protein [Hyphomicrobium sp.]
MTKPCRALGFAAIVLASMSIMGAGTARAIADPSSAAVGARDGTNINGVMRVCADPDDLPFSHAGTPAQGIYADVAELVASRLEMQPEYYWWLSVAQKKALRNTLLAGNCDAYFALPPSAATRQISISKPFMTVSYAIVADRGFAYQSLTSLRDKRVAVQFGTPPQILLAQAEGIKTFTVRTSKEGLESLSHGDVDVAFLWGPEAGYLNAQRFNSQWQVTPVKGEGLQTEIGIAVRAEDQDLLQKLNTALDDLKPQIEGVSRKYAMPAGAPVQTALNDSGAAAAELAKPTQFETTSETKVAADDASQHAATAAPTTAPSAAPAPPAPTLSVEEARSFFNNHCSHCHAPNAQSPIQERDLRRLSKRYKDKWRDVATTTIKKGRTELGMPTWEDILTDQDIQNVLVFLETIQKN